MRPTALSLSLGIAIALAIAPGSLEAQSGTPVVPDTVQTDTARTNSVTVDTAQAAEDSSTTRAVMVATPEEEGRRDGLAAGSVGGGLRTERATAFLIGVPVGFFTPLALVGHKYLTLTAAGAAIVIAKHQPRDIELPPDLARAAEERGPAYEQAFRRGYQERMARRRRAARSSGLWGVATGVAGLGVFLTLVASGT
ncbi:MAG TPA: hypothetical protein VFH27_00485 [Longimicrobiaceae bacterium]|nr:hypothetical protein [Longimicrobiaceae bacterium]